MERERVRENAIITRDPRDLLEQIYKLDELGEAPNTIIFCFCICVGKNRSSCCAFPLCLTLTSVFAEMEGKADKTKRTKKKELMELYEKSIEKRKVPIRSDFDFDFDFNIIIFFTTN
jgi:hypothetical protein